MSRYAYEDAVNEEFIKKAAQIVADAIEDGTDQHDYIQKLADLYESMIDALPEPTDEDDE